MLKNTIKLTQKFNFKQDFIGTFKLIEFEYTTPRNFSCIFSTTDYEYYITKTELNFKPFAKFCEIVVLFKSDIPIVFSNCEIIQIESFCSVCRETFNNFFNFKCIFIFDEKIEEEIKEKRVFKIISI
jgi:hypothetical protein